MNTEEKILQMLETIRADIIEMKADVASIKEIQGEHTTALNSLIEWADDAQVVVKIPFAQTK